MDGLRHRRGFTLLELLVVLAIIGLLVGLVFPSLSKGRASSQAIACQGRLRQIALVVQMYADENNGAVLHSYDVAGQDSVGWVKLVQPYLQKPESLRCPLDGTRAWEPDPFLPTQGLRTTSYAINDTLTPEADPPVQQLSRIKHVEKVVLLAELRDELVGDHFHPANWALFLGTPEEEIAHDRHSGQAFYAFADYHVEKLPLEKVWQSNGTVNLMTPPPQ